MKPINSIYLRKTGNLVLVRDEKSWAAGLIRRIAFLKVGMCIGICQPVSGSAVIASEAPT